MDEFKLMIDHFFGPLFADVWEEHRRLDAAVRQLNARLDRLEHSDD